MKSATRILVTGAGGFIGHHLVSRLKDEGYWVRGVDIKEPEYEPTAADEFQLLDLRSWHNALQATSRINQVYNLAADMGGIGYITAKLADIARNNILINAHMLEAARERRQRYLFSSSACVYAGYKQNVTDLAPLKEEDAHPADPEPGYGWEKLFTEQLCRYFRHDYGLRPVLCASTTSTARLAPTKVARRKLRPPSAARWPLHPRWRRHRVWGDGRQTRSFMFIPTASKACCA